MDLNCATPVAPYTNWATAATSIQDAVDAANNLDTVLVTNGVYRTGGRATSLQITNRLVVTKSITVQSVNGPDFTVIEGYQVPGSANGDAAIRCVYLSGNAVLSGFTLTNGATRATMDESGCGGAAYMTQSSCLTNCVLTGSTAYYLGGGAHSRSYALVIQSKLIGNSAFMGGGAHGALLDTCWIMRNSAP
ncbi:MAG TPA: hypothetical protein VFE51_04600, partial [Verrucomicrobiae bacterium]|nr:hypothetical protein [Verrucomicrobiae bacterium]